MKSLLLTVLNIVFVLSAVQAQNEQVIQVKRSDTIRVIADSTIVEIKNDGQQKRLKLIFEYGSDSIGKPVKVSLGKEDKQDEVRKENPFFIGLTFSRFDLGLAKILDNGKVNLSPTNEFLDYKTWKTINVGFDVFKMGYKFTDQFKMQIAAGFDWTHIRLKENILFLEDTRPLTYVESDINYSKNRFSTSYLHLPLTFELRTKAGALPKRLSIAAGPMAGILLQGSQKVKSDAEGKNKVKDDFNFAPLNYGAFARVSYGSLGVYAKYYFNDMFVDSPNQEGLKNLSFGISLLL
jgi:hypothetical protein